MKSKRVKADIRGRAMAWLFLLCAMLLCLRIAVLPGFYLFNWHGLSNELTPGGFGAAQADEERIAEAIARALDGDLDALRLRIAADGQERDAFNEREIAHMRDVASLFRLAKTILWIGGGALLALAAWTWRTARRNGLPDIAKGALMGAADIAVLIVAVAAWALIDFRSVFWLFHQVAFTNDLWLLDPATDLLIQRMPQVFFERAASQIALCWAGCALLWCLCWRAVLGRTRRSGGDGGGELL